MNRKQILDEAAKAVTTERQSAYGTPENSFTGIADYWNIYMAQRAEGPLTAHDVGMMLLLMKVRRTAVSPGKADNYVDMAGYAACVGEISTGDVRVELPLEEGGWVYEEGWGHTDDKIIEVPPRPPTWNGLMGETGTPEHMDFPDPPAGRKWHNPEGLTAEQVGVADGWRLCLEDEVADINHEWYDNTDGQWEKGRIKPTTTFGGLPTTTYRTKAPLP